MFWCFSPEAVPAEHILWRTRHLARCFLAWLVVALWFDRILSLIVYQMDEIYEYLGRKVGKMVPSCALCTFPPKCNPAARPLRFDVLDACDAPAYVMNIVAGRFP